MPRARTQLAHELLTRLETACPRVGVRDLPATAAAVGAETRKQIAKAIEEICFPEHCRPGEMVVDAEGVTYEIRVAERPDNPSRLGVAVVPYTFGNSLPKLHQHEIKTPSLLRTQAATVHLPSKLIAYQDEVVSVASDMILAGSTWFEGRLMSSLRIAETDVISSLYTYFRSLLPTPLQATPIWFSAASRRHGHYVLDPGVVAGMLPDLVASADTLSSAPASCVAAFLNAAVPVEQTFAVEVVKAGVCLDIDFKLARYKDNLTALQLSEIAIFGGTAASAFPIYTDGSTYLIAAFPTELKDELLPILESAKTELARRFVQARSPIDRAFRRLVMRGARLSPSDLGEFTGALLASVASSLGKQL
jgi:hypothetical protein